MNILETDKFGKLKVKMEGCLKRYRFFFTALEDREIPVAVDIGCGYSPDIRTIVVANCKTFKMAEAIYG